MIEADITNPNFLIPNLGNRLEIEKVYQIATEMNVVYVFTREKESYMTISVKININIIEFEIKRNS